MKFQYEYHFFLGEDEPPTKKKSRDPAPTDADFYQKRRLWEVNELFKDPQSAESRPVLEYIDRKIQTCKEGDSPSASKPHRIIFTAIIHDLVTFNDSVQYCGPAGEGLFDGTGKMRSDGMISRSVCIFKETLKYVYSKLKPDDKHDSELWNDLWSVFYKVADNRYTNPWKQYMQRRSKKKEDDTPTYVKKCHEYMIEEGPKWNEYLVKNGLKPWDFEHVEACLLYTSPSPRDVEESRMPSSA